jgi:hypothetical protein
MATLTVKNVPEPLVQRLERQALLRRLTDAMLGETRDSRTPVIVVDTTCSSTSTSRGARGV